MKRLLVQLAAAAAALVLAAPVFASETRWATMPLSMKQELVARTIHRDRGAVRWWVKHQAPDVFFSKLRLPGPPLCSPLGIRAPARVCGRALELRHAQHVLANLRATLPWTDDWETAVRVVQRVFPGSQGWLLSCSGSEGGHGAWQWRHPNGSLRYDQAGAPIYVADIPGGPMQYFESTFRSDFNAAVTDLWSRGVRVPRAAFSWYSQLGQAVAGGWAFFHARPAGKWTGANC